MTSHEVIRSTHRGCWRGHRDGDRVVLVKRAHEPFKGEWSLPGGSVEVGESLVEAVTREVFEETDLHVRVGPLVEVLDRIHRDPTGGSSITSSSSTICVPAGDVLPRIRTPPIPAGCR